MSSYVLATYFSQKLCIYNYRSTSDIFLYICTLIQLAAAARLSVQVNKLYIFVRSLGYCPLKQFIAIFMNYFQGGYYVDNIKSFYYSSLCIVLINIVFFRKTYFAINLGFCYVLATYFNLNRYVFCSVFWSFWFQDPSTRLTTLNTGHYGHFGHFGLCLRVR